MLLNVSHERPLAPQSANSIRWLGPTLTGFSERFVHPVAWREVRVSGPPAYGKPGVVRRCVEV